MRLLEKIFVISTLTLSTGCALLGGGDDDIGKKNSQLKFVKPGGSFEEVSVSSADKVWQSTKTGNTIAINSLCKKDEDITLEGLKKNILSGFENIKVEKSENVNFDGQNAEKITASGTADGVPVTVSLLILKKNGCSYDLAYVATASHFEKEQPVFEKFLKGFHAP